MADRKQIYVENVKSSRILTQAVIPNMYLEVIKSTANVSICRCLGEMPFFLLKIVKGTIKRREYKGHSKQAMFSSLKLEVNSNILTVLQQFMDYMDYS